MGLIPGMQRYRGGGPGTPVFQPGESLGGRSLAGYNPQGHKESDTTEATELAHTMTVSYLKMETYTNVQVTVQRTVTPRMYSTVELLFISTVSSVCFQSQYSQPKDSFLDQSYCDQLRH